VHPFIIIFAVPLAVAVIGGLLSATFLQEGSDSLST